MLHVVDARHPDPDLLPMAAVMAITSARHIVVDAGVPESLGRSLPAGVRPTVLSADASPDQVVAALAVAAGGGSAVWLVARDPSDVSLGPVIRSLALAGLDIVTVPGVGRSAAGGPVDVDRWPGRPLYGRAVVVTRPFGQSSQLADALSAVGAVAVVVPTIAIVDAADGGEALRSALGDLGRYDWLVLTSPNGADRVLAEMRDARALAGVRIAAIGPGTAARLQSGNVVADLVPERFVAEGLLEVFPPAPEPGRRVLLARAAVARDVLPAGLEARGWAVDVVEAYRTEPAPLGAGTRERVMTADAVTFTSSSTVTQFMERFGPDLVPPVVACIGPVTAATARDAGLDVSVEAEVHTIDGLVRALVDHVRR